MSLEKKYDIFEKALKAIFKMKVLIYSNTSATYTLTYTVRINLTTINYKDFIYTIPISRFNEENLNHLVFEIVMEFVKYIRGFYIDEEAYDLVSKLLQQ